MIVSVFEFDDYLPFLKKWLAARPKRGYGELRRVAAHLEVSSTMVSQIFKGEKTLSLEAAVLLAEYMNLDRAETDFFFLLVQKERAGTAKLRAKFAERIEEVREQRAQLAKRIGAKPDLPHETLLEFYSHWSYTAIWNLASLGKFNSVEEIAERLIVPESQVRKAVGFMLEKKMLAFEGGILKPASASTHLASDSPYLARHHANWRLQAIDHLSRGIQSRDLFFSGPMNLSAELAEKIRAELPDFIEKIIKRVVPSEPEVVRCLTIDWFEY